MERNKIEIFTINNMKKIIFYIFRKITKPFLGKGLGKMPFLPAIYNNLLGRLKPKSLVLRNVNSSKMWIDPNDTSLAPTLLVKGIWEEGVTNVFRNFIKPGMVVVDVGANIGYYTLLSAMLVGNQGKVYAFEPISNNYELLMKSVKENNYFQVAAVQKAVSEKDEKVTMFLHPTGSGAHTMGGWDAARKSIEVESTKLDTFFPKGSRVNFLKIDVEGFEYAALRGARRIIEENSNLLLLVEFWPKGMINSGDSPDEFISELNREFSYLYTIDDRLGKIKISNDIHALMKIADEKISVNIICSKKPLE